MALRVWLPLNGNLNNNGLSNAIITAFGTTIDNNGKIGKTYLFDANDDYISINNAELYNCFRGGSQPFSIAMWVYNTKTTGSRAVLFGDYGLTGTIQFNIELNSGSNYNDDIRFYWAGSPDYRATGTNVAPNTWVHIAVVYDGEKIEFYRNGILINTRTGTLSEKNKTEGVFYLGRDSRTGGTAFGGYLNDIRIYDEALSPKQIKEISKGLVAHYKLDGLKANSNLAKETFASSPSGFNDYTSKASASRIKDSGVCTSVYKIDFPEDSGTYSNYNLYVSIPRDSSAVAQDGRTYTLSFKIKASKNLESYHLYYEFNNKAIDVNVGTEWQKVVLTGIANNQYSALYVCQYQTNRVKINGGSLYLAEIKLELGNVATPWIPNEADTLYTALGYNNNACVDVSGNGYKLTKVGNFSTQNNSGRYETSLTRTSGSDNRFYCTDMYLGNQTTFSFWIKPTDLGSTTQWIVYLGGGTGNASEIQHGIYINSTAIRLNAGVQTTYNISLNTDQWYHIVSVVDNTTGKVYLNGQLVLTGTTSYIQKTLLCLFDRSGNSSGTSAGGYQYYGNLSDVRIYATALSADDILTMYKNSGIIDNKNNVYAYEFKEE